jgi:hypothetical protein
MVGRLMRVNAFTTLDLVDVRVRSADESVSTLGVANVTSDRENPEVVRVQVEADDHPAGVAAHVDELELAPEQARSLAAALESHADRVGAGSSASDGVDADDSRSSST